MNERFLLSNSYMDGSWQEVTKEQWVKAERAAGFYNKYGPDSEPATSSFSGNGGLMGRRVAFWESKTLPADAEPMKEVAAKFREAGERAESGDEP